jgi:CRISPR type IV-associated protein Csf3
MLITTKDSYAPFVVMIHLRTPCILDGTTLPGILAAILYERTQSIEDAHSTIPLARHMDQGRPIWLGSDLFRVGASAELAAPFTRAVKPGQVLTADMVRGDRGGKVPRIETVRGPTKNLLSFFAARASERVVAFGTGDIDAIRELLFDLRSIGKKRNTGYGEVARVSDKPWITVSPVSTTTSVLGLTDLKKHAARSLPVATWNKLIAGDLADRDGGVLNMGSVAMPKWTGTAEACAQPLSQSVAQADVAGLFVQ